jgi:hypothetical protein
MHEAPLLPSPRTEKVQNPSRTDLTLEAGQVWRGTVSPLVMRYAVYEERRLVIVAAAPLLLPGSGLPGQ